MDKETIINRFGEIEERIEQLIENCKRLEAENAELKTLNTKHYPMLKDIKPAYKK